MTVDLNKQIAIAADIRNGMANYNDSDVVDYFVAKLCGGIPRADNWKEGISDIELAEFIGTAKADDAIPGEEIFIQKFKNRKDGGYYPATIIHGYTWMLRKARETGIFAGFELPEYLDDKGKWHKEFYPLDPQKSPPRACKIKMKIHGTDERHETLVRWDQRVKLYNGKPQAMWATDPIGQLLKCTMVQSWRTAGLKGFSGKYIQEEMPDETPNGQWVNPDPVQAGRDAIDRHDQARRARAGDLELIDDKTLDFDDRRVIKIKEAINLRFKELKIKKAESVATINEILRANELPTVEKLTDLTYKNAVLVCNGLDLMVDEKAGGDDGLFKEKEGE